ncbi:MAG TPA: hypothetical protein VGU23_04250 [Acidobacteriaceae bacterium]|nr:hypothetical protein [Acidobacteriaceae bacterium]
MQPPNVYVQQPGGYPATPPKSSGGAVKIILIIIAVIVGIGLLGAAAVGFFAWRVAKSVNVNSNGTAMTMSVPGAGTISAGDTTATDADLGVPAYPGAMREKGGMNLNSGSASMVMAHFSTSDSPNQVVDYYKSKMGDGTVAIATGNGTVLNSGGKDTDRIMVTVGPGTGDDAGKTTIVVMHTKKK